MKMEMPARKLSEMHDMSSLRELKLPSDWASGIFIVYDGECPFCSSFVKFQRVRAALGKLTLVNARDQMDLVAQFSALGFPLDEGMALIVDGRVYYGADCLNRLALMSGKTDVINRINARLFRSPSISHFIYPALKLGRRMVLTLLGKKRLEQD